ncbi:MAG: PIG-L family deacetylase [Planctomycetota bacterium]|nr:MAG: PIG-L family deacetylase [Planctomycetota bacterium]
MHDASSTNALDEACRVLVLGAHPDDAEFFAGGLLHEHRKHGAKIQLVSVTNGQSGHHEMSSDALVARRRIEAREAGSVLGCRYDCWDFPDGYLEPSLAVREAIIRQIRDFQPDLVLTHRPWDYHPDHRAVGQAVQDASYMVMVPKVAPGYPVPRREPVVAYMVDLFTRPSPFRADFTLDATEHLGGILRMLQCHRSQFAEWIPWIERLGPAPSDPGDWDVWLKEFFLQRTAARTQRFWNKQWGPSPGLVEAYEVSEYAGKLSAERQARLFPACRSAV